VFIGSYEHTIDVKGRMAVPSRLRDRLGERMYVTRWLDKCLALFPADQFEALAEKVSSLSIGDPNARNLRRIFFSEAAEVAPDKQGRINIPARLRQFAGVSADDAQVAVVGMNNFVEIWAMETWNEVQEEAEQNVDTMAAALANIGAI
jgi:MraZ protein